MTDFPDGIVRASIVTSDGVSTNMVAVGERTRIKVDDLVGILFSVPVSGVMIFPDDQHEYEFQLPADTWMGIESEWVFRVDDIELEKKL